jgi:hypothetical protein
MLLVTDRNTDTHLPSWHVLFGKYHPLFMKTTILTRKAVLAMPFFDDDPWMKKVNKFWVWIILTVPCTALAFTFYMMWRKRETDRKKKRADDTMIEMQEAGEP